MGKSFGRGGSSSLIKAKSGNRVLRMQGFESKVKRLKEIVSGYARGDLIVAFSGGTDSSLILKTACEAAEKTNHTVYGIYLHTLLHPAGEIDAAAKTADEIGAVFKVLEIDELKEAGIE